MLDMNTKTEIKIFITIAITLALPILALSWIAHGYPKLAQTHSEFIDHDEVSVWVGQEIDHTLCTHEFITCTNEYVAVITAYHCLHRDCINAAGTTPDSDSVACPRDIPLQTEVFIEGVGEKRCDDRTHIRFNGRYDIFMGYGRDGFRDAREFGKQQREVLILNE